MEMQRKLMSLCVSADLHLLYPHAIAPHIFFNFLFYITVQFLIVNIFGKANSIFIFVMVKDYRLTD